MEQRQLAWFFFAESHEVAGSNPAPAIEQNATGPRQATADGVNVQQHSLPDQIAADKYLAGKRAVSKNPAKAFTRVKIVSPGTV